MTSLKIRALLVRRQFKIATKTVSFVLFKFLAHKNEIMKLLMCVELLNYLFEPIHVATVFVRGKRKFQIFRI